jgi:hypothetical protein
VVDRRVQTIAGNAVGEIYAFACNANGTFPVVDGITFRNVTIRKGAAAHPNLIFSLKGLTSSGLHFNGCDFRDNDAAFETPSTSVVRSVGSAWATLVDGSATGKFELDNSSMSGAMPTTIGYQSRAIGSSGLADVRSGIVASSTQTQGQGALTARYNDVTTCVSNNDTVTMPPASLILGPVTVINWTANVLQIFPATGDYINGGAVNVPITLASALAVTLLPINASEWRML